MDHCVYSSPFHLLISDACAELTWRPLPAELKQQLSEQVRSLDSRADTQAALLLELQVQTHTQHGTHARTYTHKHLYTCPTARTRHPLAGNAPVAGVALPISGRLLATPISGKGGCLGPPLRSRVPTGRFLKFKRHSIRLNMIHISIERNFKNSYKGVLGG